MNNVVNTTVVTEAEFLFFHDRLKQDGRRILRCIEKSGTEKGRVYAIVWI